MNAHSRPRAVRRVTPKVTKADLERAAQLLLAVGAKVAAIDVTPGGLRIITTDGRGLTVDDDTAKLDGELRKLIDEDGEG
jgi:hypothetical protein